MPWLRVYAPDGSLLEHDSSDLTAQLSRGEFGALKTWLNDNIHRHGKRYRAEELCRKLTGQPLSADALMRYLEGKIRPIYGI